MGHTIRNLARKIKHLNAEIQDIDSALLILINQTAPSLLKLHGVGPDTAASVMVTVGDNPERLRSERAWASLVSCYPGRARSCRDGGYTFIGPALRNVGLITPTEWRCIRRQAS